MNTVTDPDEKLKLLRRLQRCGDWMLAFFNPYPDVRWSTELYYYIQVKDIFSDEAGNTVIHGMFIEDIYVDYVYNLEYVDAIAPSSQFDFFDTPLDEIINLQPDELYTDVEMDDIMEWNDGIFFAEDMDD